MIARLRSRLQYILILVILLYLVNFYHHTKLLPKPKLYNKNKNITTLSKDPNQECQIPRLSPWKSKSTVSFRNESPPPRCYNSNRSLFTIDYQNNLIRLNPNPKYWNKTLWNTSNCVYIPNIPISRMPGVEEMTAPSLIDIIEDSTELAANVEHLYVSCVNIFTRAKIYEDYLSAVQIKPDLEAKLDAANGGKEFYSVIIIGQDSSSHMNFIRTMPEVHDFLINELDAVEFHGFNSLGPTTLWSINPLLSGLELLEFTKACYGRGSFKNTCPFIWKEFEKQGYRTAYDEDGYSMFSAVGHRPFTRQPFHYDFRKISTILHVALKGHKTGHFMNPYCYGSRLSMSVLLDNVIRMATTFRNKPYWTMVWAEQLSHAQNTFSKYGEPSMLSSLQHLHNNQLLNNTILIMLSDHGMWWRDFLKHDEQLFLEQRLPLLYIALPKNFKEKYPVASKNLKENAGKLTTTFDVYEMIKDLLDLTQVTDKRINERAQEVSINSRRNVSLFLPINPKRTCVMAGISFLNCACLSRKAASLSDPSVITAAEYIVERINKNVRQFKMCSKLKLANITDVFKIGMGKPGNFTKKQTIVNQFSVIESHGGYFEIGIDTKPGRGKYYATVFVNGFDGRYGVNEIARTSIYGNDADCMPYKLLKPYCHCI